VLPQLDGGHNLTMLEFFFVCFFDTGRRPLSHPFFAHVSNALSNVAFFLARMQLVTLYFSCVLYKLQGPLWVDGVAMYYIVQADEFYHPWWSELVKRSDLLITFSTYGTILWELAYGFLIWTKQGRPWLLALACLFHLGTILAMGLTTFGIAMIICNMLFLTEPWLARGSAILGRWMTVLRRMRPRSFRGGGCAQASAVSS
jgi:hypothetical protein